MGTRAIFTFTDDIGSFHVYKHWDGHPTESGAIGAIRRAMKFAWDLPRFEADDFAAAFVAANKKIGGGDIRLTNTKDCDWTYCYAVRLRDADDCFPAMLHVKIYDRDYLIDEVWLEPETV